MRKPLKLAAALALVPRSAWSISTPCAIGLYWAVHNSRAKSVVEFGSGLSTMALAVYALRTGASVLTLEHDPKWADIIRTLLERVKATHLVEVRHVPMTEQTHFGISALTYDIGKVPEHVDFAFIDGPPHKLSSREGTLPSIASNLAESGWSAWLHDGCRPTEAECVRVWRDSLPNRFTSALHLEHDGRGVFELKSRA